MTKSELNTIKHTKRWPFKFSDIYNRYYIIIFPVFILFIGVSQLYSGIEQGLVELEKTGACIFTAGLLALIFVIRRLYQNYFFKEYLTKRTSIEEVKTILKANGAVNLKYYAAGYFQFTMSRYYIVESELVTVIPCETTVLINSQSNSYPIFTRPITIFRRKKKIRNMVKDFQN